MHSFEMCLIISGSIQFISIIKISEEAGIQILGPDNVAIWKVRVIVISTSSLLSLLMIKNSTAFEHDNGARTIYTYIYGQKRNQKICAHIAYLK